MAEDKKIVRRFEKNGQKYYIEETSLGLVVFLEASDADYNYAGKINSQLPTGIKGTTQKYVLMGEYSTVPGVNRFVSVTESYRPTVGGETTLQEFDSAFASKLDTLSNTNINEILKIEPITQKEYLEDIRKTKGEVQSETQPGQVESEQKVQETPSQEFIDHATEMAELGVLDPAVKEIICANYPDLCAELNATVVIPYNKQTPEQLLKSLREKQRQKNIKDGKIAATCPALSDTTGKTILLADPCKDNFFAKVEAHLTNFFDKITKLGSKILNFPQELKTVVGQIGRAASTFVGTMVSKLTKAINKFISNGLAKLTQQIFNTVAAPAQALLKIVGIEEDLLNPVKALNKALACLATKITQALTSVIEDLIMGMVRNVLNVPTCAVQQFIGALTTKIINLIDSAITPLLGPISKILGAVFKVKDFLVGAVKTIRKVLSFLKCGEKEKCPPSRKYIIDRGVKNDRKEKEQEDLLDKINNFSLTETVGQGISNFEKEYGSWDIFGSGPGAGDSGIGGSNCNTGNAFACGAPKATFFGGDGIGASGKVILGKFMKEFDTDNIGGDIKRTASVIGVEISDPGSGYTDAPFVSFDDNCDRGYGAYGKVVIDTNINSPTYGQVTSVIIVSEGENYPAENEEESYIRDVIIENPGVNYEDGDDLENDDLEITVDNGVISSVAIKKPIKYTDLPKLNIRTETGYGAVLRPIMTTKQPPQREILRRIDCVS